MVMPSILRINLRAILVLWALMLVIIGSKKIQGKDGGQYGIMFNNMVIANLGYLVMAIAKDISAYKIGVVMTYWGGGFAIFSMLNLSLSICRVKERWITVMNVCSGITLFNAFLSLTIPRATFFFKELNLFYNDAANCIDGRAIPNYGGKFYLCMLGLYMFISVVAAIYALKTPEKVPIKYALIILVLGFLGGFVFLIQHVWLVSVAIIPYYYCLSGTVHLWAASKTELYDVNRVLEKANERYGDKGIMVVDKSRRFLGVNDYQLKVAPPLAKLHLDKPVPKNVMFSEMYDKAYDELDASGDNATVERRFSYKDKHFKVIIRNLLDDKKRRIGYVIENIDDTKTQNYINEIKKINVDLKEANEKAEAARKAKTIFLASVTHEFRTPINAVLGLNNIILSNTKEEDTRKHSVDIQNAGNSLLALVNDLLDVSKIENGKMNIINDNYDVASLLNDCYNMVAFRSIDKGLKFTVINDENFPAKLYGDEIRIRQVLVNILTNAFKYTDTGSIVMSVSYENIDAENITAIFSVKDTGKGISEEGLKHLFSDFTRVDEKRNKNIEGTGLGLSIVKQLTELMHGEIEVKSKLDVGTEFIVRIPNKVVSREPLGNFEKNLSKFNQQAAVSSNRLINMSGNALLVDDVATNRKVFALLLGNTNLSLDQADCGDHAIKLSKEKKYDVIFMDYMMPGKDGIDTFREIKSDENNPNKNTPIVMLTANTLEDDIKLFREEGFSGYLSKPIVRDELEDTLLSLIPTLQK